MFVRSSRSPQRKPSSTNNNAHSIDNGHGNFNNDQVCIGDQNASFLGGELRSACCDGFLRAGRVQLSTAHQLDVSGTPGAFGNVNSSIFDGLQNHADSTMSAYSPPPSSPSSSVMSTRFPYNNTQLSTTHRLSASGTSETFDSTIPSIFDGFQDHISSSWSADSPSPLSPLPSANGYPKYMGNKLIYHLPDYAPLAVTPLAYWASTPAPTCCLPPPMVAPSPENESSPSLRCMKCPKMPKFSTQKDLERHLNTSQAHQDEGTPLYRCCCTRSRPRKDNHLRHVRTCIAESRGSYTCICGRESPVRDEHIEHVHNCGRVRRRQRSATT